MDIADIDIGERYRHDLGDIDSLAKSISDVGLLNPITVTTEYKLIAGARRIEAAKRLGWTEIDARVVDLESIIRGEYAENAYRKDFTPSELVAISEAIWPKVEEEARKRQGARNDLRENFADVYSPKPQRTSDTVASTLGVSGRTLEKARAVVDSGDAELVQRMDETGSVDGAYKEYRKAHVANNSGENEWYTPKRFIDAARATMGSIDCDPASSDMANETVNADTYYTAEDDGLLKTWHGNVWMNPPYAQPLVKHFCESAVSKYKSGEINQACVLVNNATETAFFQHMLEVTTAVCFPRGRVQFIDKNGNPSGAPLQGQAILYLGKNTDGFVKAFSEIGAILYGRAWED